MADQKNLFYGIGCFSPTVLRRHKVAWRKNGGRIAQNANDFHASKWFFCSGLDDPWLSELSARSLVVFHASWVSECAAHRRRLPVSRFILDSRFDPAYIHGEADCSTSFSIGDSNLSLKRTQSPHPKESNKKPRLDPISFNADNLSQSTLVNSSSPLKSTMSSASNLSKFTSFHSEPVVGAVPRIEITPDPEESREVEAEARVHEENNESASTNRPRWKRRSCSPSVIDPNRAFVNVLQKKPPSHGNHWVTLLASSKRTISYQPVSHVSATSLSRSSILPSSSSPSVLRAVLAVEDVLENIPASMSVLFTLGDRCGGRTFRCKQKEGAKKTRGTKL